MTGLRRTARLPFAVWLVFVVACAIITARAQVSTDLTAFLPRSPTPAQQVLVEQLREGVVSRLMLVGIEGEDAAALARASKSMAAVLRRDEAFASVNNGENVGMEQDSEFIWHNRYLLSPAVTPEHFTAPALRAALEEALQALGSPAGTFLQKALPADPTGELIRLLDEVTGQARPASRDGVWFSADGKRALMVLQTRAAGFDIDAQAQALERVRAAFAASGSAQTAKLLVAGPGVISVNSRDTIKNDAWKISTIATVLIAIMLLVLYRSPLVLLLGLLPVASGAIAGVAAVSLFFGSVHGITLGFGVTLIGECVDYGIYLFTQVTPGARPEQTLRRIWPTLRLGVITSICGFSAMLLSGFPGLAQLGLFSITGLIVAVSVARWVLPGLLPEGFYARAVDGLAPAVSRVVTRAPALRMVLLALVIAGAAVLLLRHNAMWTENLGSLSPVPASAQALDEKLRGDLGAPDVRNLVVLHAPTEQAALEAAERVGGALQRLVEQGALGGFESPAATLPSKATQQGRQAALPAKDGLHAALSTALEGLPFRGDLFAPFERDIEIARTQRLLDRESLAGTRLSLKLDSLLIKRGEGWMVMMPLRAVTKPDAIEGALKQSGVADVVLVDLLRESDNLYRTYRNEAMFYSMLGVAAIVVMLLVTLRSPMRVLRVLAPLVAAVVVTLALLVADGSRLTIFHLVGILLVVAVGSNYSLFFEQQSPVQAERERTLTSVLFANLSTVLGFGLLSVSGVPLLHAIGATVGVGAVLSLVFSAILMGRQPAAVT